MERVQTGGYLHGLNLIYSLAGCIERTAQLQWRTTVGISILANEILHFLGIYERSGESMLLGDNRIVILETILSEHRLYLLVWTRSNLINHRPRIGNLAAVIDIIYETSLYDTILCPTLSISLYASLNMVAVVRTVVGRLKSKWQLACLITLIEKSGKLTHSKYSIETTCQIGIIIRISLLCDGESYHLQSWCLENLDQSGPVLTKLLIRLEAFCDRSDDLLLDGSVALEADEKREIIVRAISLVDNFVVEAFSNNNTPIVLAGVKCIVEDGCRKSTEDVTCTKVNPSRLIVSLLSYGCDVILRKLITLSFPFCSIKAARKNFVQFHD